MIFKINKEIDLSNNHLTCIQDGLFKECTNLITINLSTNKISELGSECFSGLSNLNVIFVLIDQFLFLMYHENK